MSAHHEVNEHDMSSSDSETHPQAAAAPISAISPPSSNRSSTTQPLPPLPTMPESSTPMSTPGLGQRAGIITESSSPAGLGMSMPLPSPNVQPRVGHLTEPAMTYLPPQGAPPFPHPQSIMRSSTSVNASAGATPRPRSTMRSVATGNGGGTQRGSMATSMEKVGELEGVPVSPSGRPLDLPGLRDVGRKDDRYSAMQRQVSSRPHMSYRRDRNGDLEGGMGAGMDDIDPSYFGDDYDNDDQPPCNGQTVEARLDKTIENATREMENYEKKAKWSGYALNFAIGMQVFLSALITALSAVTSGKRTQVMTSILGGAGTVVASYLARARGSNEPQLSITRKKQLQRFLRKCEAFKMDHGKETGLDKNGSADSDYARMLHRRIKGLRSEFENLLGNGDGQRKLSST